MPNTRIHVYLPADLASKLEHEAELHKMSLSAYCSQKLNATSSDTGTESKEESAPITNAAEAEARAAEVHELLQFIIEERHAWMGDMKELTKYVMKTSYYTDIVLQALLDKNTYQDIQKKFEKAWAEQEED